MQYTFISNNDRGWIPQNNHDNNTELVLKSAYALEKIDLALIQINIVTIHSMNAT